MTPPLLSWRCPAYAAAAKREHTNRLYSRSTASIIPYRDTAGGRQLKNRALRTENRELKIKIEDRGYRTFYALSSIFYPRPSASAAPSIIARAGGPSRCGDQ